MKWSCAAILFSFLGFLMIYIGSGWAGSPVPEYGDTNPGEEKMIVVKTVNSRGDPFSVSRVMWYCRDKQARRGLLIPQSELPCDTWVMEQVEGCQLVTTASFSEKSKNDPECSRIFFGKSDLKPGQRLLELVLLPAGTACR